MRSYHYMVEQSKLVASIQIFKIAFVCNWQLLSYPSTWCRHEHDAQISALAVADDFLPERRWGQISVPFCSCRQEHLYLFLLQSLVPQGHSHQTTRSEQYEISHLRLQLFLCNHLWAVAVKSLAGPAFCSLCQSFT